MKGFKYTYLLLFLVIIFFHVLTLVADFVFARFDFLLVLFLLIYEMIDEENYIWLSLLFGFYTDYARNGFFGPGVMLFLAFAMARFKVDIVMDMTKFYSKVLLYTVISLVYCLFNAALSGYDADTTLIMTVGRTIPNVLITVGIARLMEYRRAFKNA